MRAFLLRLALLAVCAAPARAAAPRQAAIVKSADLGPYASAVAGFSAEFRGEVVEFDLQNDAEKADAVLEKVKQAKPAVVIALGPLAANAAKRTLSDVPVVFVMVPNHEKYGLEGGNVTGIALGLSTEVQLETLKALTPAARRIGVAYNPKFSKPVIDAAAAAARAAKLELVLARVDGPDDVAGALKPLAGKVDALWMIADRSIANAEAAKALIGFSLQNKVPLFALSESQVRDGALVSLTPNYMAIGQQAGRLASRILSEKVSAGALPVAAPEGLDLALNLTSAKSIAAECTLTLEILKFAARQGYPIRVFE